MAMNFPIPHLQQAVSQCFPIPPMKNLVGATALTAASVAMLYRSFPSLYQDFKKPPNLMPWAWQLSQAAPKAWSLHQKKIVVKSIALILSAVYPYLNLIANTPFPKSFILRFHSYTDSSIVAFLGIGILVVGKKIISLFKVNISFNPFNMLISKHKMQQIPPPDWSSLPSELLGTLIFPHVMKAAGKSPQPFQNLTLVCKTWRSQFSNSIYLTDNRYMFPPLEKMFIRNRFTVHKVLTFFDRYFPPEYKGKGLHLDFKSLKSHVQDYITLDHLEAFAKRFPEASMSSLMLCIPGDWDMEKTAGLLSIFLNKGRIHQLTITPDPIKSPRKGWVQSLFDKSEEIRQFPPTYPAQLKRLLTSLEGRVSVLRLQTLSENYVGENSLFPIITSLLMQKRGLPSFPETLDLGMTTEEIQILHDVYREAPSDSTKILDSTVSVYQTAIKNDRRLLTTTIAVDFLEKWGDEKISQKERDNVLEECKNFYNLRFYCPKT